MQNKKELLFLRIKDILDQYWDPLNLSLLKKKGIEPLQYEYEFMIFPIYDIIVSKNPNGADIIYSYLERIENDLFKIGTEEQSKREASNRLYELSES